MNYQIIPPPPQLAQHVRFFWVLESEAPYIHRSLACGCPELIFHYKGTFDEVTDPDNREKSFVSGIHGQSQKFRRFITTQGFGIFGVYLYPFAIPHFLSLPADALSNEMPDLDTLLGSEGRILEEKIMLASNNYSRVTLLANFLENRLRKTQPERSYITSLVQDIIHSKGDMRVQQLAQDSCLSVRQFERKFKEYSGFSPKLFSRIVRFQSTLDEYDAKDKTLTQIAYHCGYYDQSHFIRDFKEFSGYHPKVYFDKKAEGTEWRDA
ncbi:Transcriptional regulator, AraC family [Fulvivirga imtechensis AK7]|uniref:Transcriptional regulator, AraC family n=1 Tax=Fulvivirga imtechensis AK7 TaxID=1237149 RepID=L8JJ74_9BACT|nr:helix-turn-helix domain-containing protein [Fulvivirga imtechensis]ELR68956.1 Transcriptional regulator, AraC family [Fulvivirga imtechensis AK7]